MGFGAAVASLRGANGLWIKAFDLLKSNSAGLGRHRVALLFLLFVKGPFSCGRVTQRRDCNLIAKKGKFRWGNSETNDLFLMETLSNCWNRYFFPSYLFNTNMLELG